MKKILTLRNILLGVGAILAIAAFFIAFAAGLSGTVSGMKGAIKGTIIGPLMSKTGDGPWESIGDSEFSAHAVLPLIAIIVMMVVAIAAVVCTILIKNDKAKKIVTIVMGAVVVAAAAVVFGLKDSFINSNIAKLISDGTIPAEYAETYRGYMADMLRDMHLNAGTIFTAIIGMIGGGAILGSAFIKSK